ncbi:translation initiation factor eIF3g [Rhizophagus irregularis]|uniref:Eukaryotic translation initiation factor 3 subunit G n=1 Tax=Rhizophagus irregularis TaxID=588596 RepID=A0A2I1G8F7_9GLOM|nr:translation initiation factor eIF3g [Rhizophagus irregularis]
MLIGSISFTNVTKSSWADEVGEEFDLPFETYTDENGVKTIIEYKTNDDGKKVKVTRKIKKTLITERVNKVAAERKKWAKFGDERGKKAGPDLSTTSIDQQIFLKLSTTGKHAESIEESDLNKKKAALIGKKILCRICKGDHFTTKCPYKDTLQPLDELNKDLEATKEAAPVNEPVAPENSAGGKYIPPSMRAGAKSTTGDSYKERRDDATIRVTNLSGDTTEGDIHDLFRRFGSISRVYLARDRETNICKGFAFVSFVLRDDAAKALQAINGYGYDNLILRVEWAKSSTS